MEHLLAIADFASEQESGRILEAARYGRAGRIDGCGFLSPFQRFAVFPMRSLPFATG